MTSVIAGKVETADRAKRIKHGVIHIGQVQVQEKYPVYFFFFPRSDLHIQPISACHVSNERKQNCYQIYNVLFLSSYT